MGVTLFPVDSSMMSHVGYDAGTQTLTILFHSGKRYEYSGVPPEVYAELRTADSAGSYFREEIDGCYPYRQVRGRR
ncbi:KTSC domain-containing protein [Deinococcus sp. MIMF12]|uniref:KTSC domain-containing protein n=1 Tax=Deinococcus rhizophilus TaxID=3049544 RepID=A0ABT7JK60_9DEIO|nr:KTSC domain-containing protein [Deinococcus rhizophilus]MDL2345444.1 KTSC domain-containing protein [Deinococcus rhizophilus]